MWLAFQFRVAVMSLLLKGNVVFQVEGSLTINLREKKPAGCGDSAPRGGGDGNDSDSDSNPGVGLLKEEIYEALRDIHSEFHGHMRSLASGIQDLACRVQKLEFKKEKKGVKKDRAATK